ncbi:Gfo/Idh/MocA family oxidoreductase [Verrucomicrobia bacterium]|nr:Gfo/Idh/MocA family oxidoreductase [Verrucomicrobiota bacterium]
MNRRKFVKQGAAYSAGLSTLGYAKSLRGQNAPLQKLRVGVMGLGRGRAHLGAWTQIPGVEVTYVCDIDEKRLANGVTITGTRQSKPPKGVGDFRRILDDPDVDIISIAAPNFWHAPATILACQAGKHVYVEKPGSHNARESELIVEAARKHNRHVQMGNQRRSYPSQIEAIAKLHDGVIGKVLYSRCWYKSARQSIGKGKRVPVPEDLDYNLWNGPASAYPYKDNLLHYNWHWHWHFGGGELANNGIHALDLSRWGLAELYPKRVSFLGNRYHFDDDQETPDTGVAQFDFEDSGASWEVSSCHPRKPEGLDFVGFYGSDGSMLCDGTGGYTIHDFNGKEVEKVKGTPGDLPHFTNLADCVRYGGKLNSEIGEAQISTRWCHLGNIAYRAGASLDVNPETGKILNNDDAVEKYWSREYSKGWEPKV